MRSSLGIAVMGTLPARGRGAEAAPTRHQREEGMGYFDKVAEVISGGNASMLALRDSAEAHQF